MLLAGEQAIAVSAPIPDDELLAAELGRLDRKIVATTAERRRMADLYQTGLIDLAELHRRSSEVAARLRDQQARRDSLAAERTALARGNLLRRVTDFARLISEVIDQLDRPQRQQLLRLMIDDVHVTGWHVQIRLRIPSTRPTPALATHSRRAQRHRQPGHQLCQAKNVCVPLVATDCDSHRMRQTRARGGNTP